LVLLLQAVLLPIILAPAAWWSGRRFGVKGGGAVSFAILLYSTLLLIYAATLGPEYVEEYPWQPIGTFGLRLDGLSIPFALTIYLLATALSVYSIPYMGHRIHELVEDEGADPGVKAGLYQFLYLFYAAGMLGTVLATNLIQFYIFFEVMLIPSFFLISEFGYGDRARISLMYFLWTHIGALVLLAGILALGFTAGGFDFNQVAAARLHPALTIGVGIAVTVGLFVKLAAFGLHIWLPYAHAEAPTPISALLSPAMIGIGAYAFIRILVALQPAAYQTVALGAAIWGLITMVYGGAMALMQDDVKRLLAYSSVSQMGYIIFGSATAYYLGISGAVFQYVSHGTGKAMLFMVAGALILQTNGLRSISKMGGLASKLPLTATGALLGFLTLIGVPPLNGFQSEWILFAGALAGAQAEGSALRMGLAVLALLATPLTAGYTLWAMKRIFFGPRPPELEGVREAPLTVTGPILFLGFVALLLGIYPAPITGRLIPFMMKALGG
jgi:NADH-quinone oxidoreductase subunit M